MNSTYVSGADLCEALEGRAIPSCKGVDDADALWSESCQMYLPVVWIEWIKSLWLGIVVIIRLGCVRIRSCSVPSGFLTWTEVDPNKESNLFQFQVPCGGHAQSVASFQELSNIPLLMLYPCR